MDIVHDRAAGIDISRRDAKVCVRVPGTMPGTYRCVSSTLRALQGSRGMVC
jgi:hypothetical protein